MSGQLTHSVNDVLRRLLVNMGKGVLPGAPTAVWPIGIKRPDKPDNCVTVYKTEGKRDGRSMPTGEVFSYPGIQIEVRSYDHNVGYLKADQLKTCCDEEIYNESVTFEGKTYTIVNVSRVGDVHELGFETPDSRRELFTFNAMVTILQVN